MTLNNLLAQTLTELVVGIYENMIQYPYVILYYFVESFSPVVWEERLIRHSGTVCT